MYKFFIVIYLVREIKDSYIFNLLFLKNKIPYINAGDL